MALIMNISELKNLSFPDTEVEDISIDRNTKVFSMKCSLAFMSISANDGYLIHNVILKIEEFEDVIISECWDQDFFEVSLPTKDHQINDICEFLVTDNDEFIFRGYSKRMWTEYRVKGGNVTMSHG